MKLADLGRIGDGLIEALVRRDEGIERSCVPRFGSPSTFASGLDDREGGS